MPCPFVTKLNPNYVRNYASILVKLYGGQCPVMSHAMSTFTGDNNNSSSEPQPQEAQQNKIPCPFLKGMKSNVVKEVNNDDLMAVGQPTTAEEKATFSYDNFFYEKILQKKLDHSYRVFKQVSKEAVSGRTPKGKEFSDNKPNEVTIWCSNDYLGMSIHPEVIKAHVDATIKHGSGSGGTRNITGTSPLHVQLEDSIAKLHQKEAALVFTSCYVANDTTLCTLARALPGCVIYSDEGNHASMIEGIRNSRVPKHIFRHNDPAHLEELLRKTDKSIPKLVAFETVHSMSGAVCPLEELCDVAHKYGAITFVDEVHAVGLYGEHGAGIGERDGVLHKMDIISGTLGKAFGNIGGYIASNAILIDMVRSYAPGFIFTTSQQPATMASARKAIEILSSDEGRALRKKHQDNVKYLRGALIKNRFPVEHTPSHIIPIKIGNPEKCTAICDTLLRDKKHYIQSINYPTVARGKEKLRLAPGPHHSIEAMDELVEKLKEVWIELQMPFTGLQCEGKECPFCQKPNLFDQFESRTHNLRNIACDVPNCPWLSVAA